MLIGNTSKYEYRVITKEQAEIFIKNNKLIESGESPEPGFVNYFSQYWYNYESEYNYTNSAGYSIAQLLVRFFSKDNNIENNPNVIINEVCTNNGSSLKNVDHKYIDWVELYNKSDKDVHLKSYGITDDKNEPYKYTFPSVYIKANSYLIVFFDKDGSNEELHANFSLSEKGETIYLTMPNKEVSDQINVPALNLDATYGRYIENGVTNYKMLNPTPNNANESKPLYKYIAPPEFSFDSGFYNEEFNLELNSNEDVKIYYTLDCSVPTENSTLYTEPIYVSDPSRNPNILNARDDLSIFKNNIKNPVDKMFVIRAIAISEDGNKSQVITKNYFVNKNKYKSYKIISLVTDSYNLVDENYGIYVKGKAYNDYVAGGSVGEAPAYNWSLEGRESERDCNLTYLNYGSLEMNQDCGMRIHGYGGRSIMYKSFNIYARSNYGEKYFKTPIFESATKTKSFILKYDRYSPTNEKFKDGFVQSLITDRDVVTQDYEQCYVFLNGEYWTVYSIMQKYTDDFIEEKYGVNKENVVIIKDYKLDNGTEEDYQEFKELVNFVKNHDFTKQQNYEEFKKMVDIQSFIDYYAIQLYVNNFDFSYRKNYLLWKSRSYEDNSYGDTRWRFMIYDFDYVAANVTLEYKEQVVTYDYKFDSFNGVYLYATDFKDDIFFHKLMKNEEFKNQFVMSFLDIANYNFNPQRVLEIAKTEYGYTSGKMMEFFNNRLKYMKNHLANYLNVECNTVEVKVETKREIKFNSLSLTENFSGTYYKQFPIVLYDVEKNSLFLEDISIVSDNNGKLVLKIIGDNPKIIYQ